MAQNCDCSAVVFGNTGENPCKQIQDVARHIGLTFTKDASGASKVYDIATQLAAFTGMKALIDNPAPAERVYWLTELENVTNLREDSVFQTFNSGRQAKVRDGFKNFVGMLVAAPYEMLGEIKALSCKALSALVMDKSDNLIGYKGGTSADLKPIRINTSSFDAVYVEPTETEAGGIMIKFQWALSQTDENLRVVKAGALDYTSEELYGLLTVNGASSSLTTTGVTLNLSTVYGEPVSGLLIGDFALAELSPTPGAGTITSVTETANGVYDIVWTAETTGDVLALTITKEFYDFALVNAQTYLIP